MRKNHATYQDDSELVRRYYHTRDDELIGILLEKYLHLIFGVCMRYLKDEEEAKEHAQQVCLKVIQEFHQAKNEIIYFKPWLYQVTKNHCLMFLRKKKNVVQSLETLPEISAVATPELTDEEKKYHLLEEVLETLNEPQLTCIRLFYYENKSYQEIADENDFTLKQVKSFIQNGRRNIKNNMENKK